MITFGRHQSLVHYINISIILGRLLGKFSYKIRTIILINYNKLKKKKSRQVSFLKPMLDLYFVIAVNFIACGIICSLFSFSDHFCVDFVSSLVDTAKFSNIFSQFKFFLTFGAITLLQGRIIFHYSHGKKYICFKHIFYFI